MDKQYFECVHCPAPIHGIYGHKFEVEFRNGVVIWRCANCGWVRGFCQHEVEVDSIGNPPDERTLRYCKHCNQDLSETTDSYGNIKLSDKEQDDYNDYLECGALDPRD